MMRPPNSLFLDHPSRLDQFVGVVRLDGGHVAAVGYNIEEGWVDTLTRADGTERRFGVIDVGFDWNGFLRVFPDKYREHAVSSFKAERDIADDEFNDPVNQCLFAIEYPEAR